MTDQSGPAGARLPLEGRHQAKGIFPAVVLLGLTGDIPHGIVKVGQASEGIGLLTGLDALGPAGDERHAVPAFVDVGLVPAIAGARVMAKLLQQFEVSLGGTTVVAGEENQGIFVNAGFLDCGE